MSACFCLLCSAAHPDAEQKYGRVCWRWHVKISVLGDAVFWGLVVLWAQLLSPPRGTCAGPRGGGLWAGCLVFGPCSWGRVVAGLAIAGLRCYCRSLNGLLPFGSTELRCNPGQFACRSGTIQCIPLPWQCDGWVTCEDESDEADCPGECVGQADAHGPCFPLGGDGVNWYPLANPGVGILF